MRKSGPRASLYSQSGGIILKGYDSSIHRFIVKQQVKKQHGNGQKIQRPIANPVTFYPFYLIAKIDSAFFRFHIFQLLPETSHAAGTIHRRPASQSSLSMHRPANKKAVPMEPIPKRNRFPKSCRLTGVIPFQRRILNLQSAGQSHIFQVLHILVKIIQALVTKDEL